MIVAKAEEEKRRTRCRDRGRIPPESAIAHPPRKNSKFRPPRASVSVEPRKGSEAMAARTLHELIRHLRGAATAAGAPGGATDAQLLERFASGGDQDAFELLLWRHAGTVLGVC